LTLKGYILEMKASMVQQKCIEALKGEVVMPVNLTKPKKDNVLKRGSHDGEVVAVMCVFLIVNINHI